MKNGKILAAVLALGLLLTACDKPQVKPTGTETPPQSTQAVTSLPADTKESEATETLSTAPATEAAPENGENPAFTDLAGRCDGSFLGLLCNDPSDPRAPQPTETWNEGAFDRLLICPRWPGTQVSAYRLREDGSLEGPVYSSVSGEGSVIAAALDRPEGSPAWCVILRSPQGYEGGFTLQYNGNTGTPFLEFVTDPRASALYDALPAYETVEPLEQMLGEQVLWSFLRESARKNLDPWEAMTRCCAVYGDFGDSAAFTLWSHIREGDACHLLAARFREGYYEEGADLTQATAFQYAGFLAHGNELGILGPEPVEETELYYTLTGLTVYNPFMAAKTVDVSVNGQDLGSFALREGDLCTILPFDSLPRYTADKPVEIQVRILETREGFTPDTVPLEVWPALGGSVSGER